MSDRPAARARLIAWRQGLLAIGLLVLAPAATAEQGILVVHVSDPASRPIDGVQIGVKGDGSLARTGSDGKARIVLAPVTTAGSPITLTLGPQDAAPGEEWVFRSPDDGRTVVPSFENDSENYVPVVLETLAARNEVAAIVEALVDSHRLRESELQGQIRALTSAVEALADQRDQPDPPLGVDQALAALAEGETSAAESIFSELLERKTMESVEARKEAAVAARHLGALTFLDRPQDSLAHYRRSVELDPEDFGAWNWLGVLLHRTGEMAGSEAAYRKAAELATQHENRAWLAIVKGNLGLLYWALRDLERAESLLRDTIALSEELDELSLVARHYGNLGLVYWVRGDYDQAESMFRRSLAQCEELGDASGATNARSNLATVHQARGDLEAAEQIYLESIALSTLRGDSEGRATSLGNLGAIYVTRGDLAKAEETLHRALDLNKSLGRREGMAIQYDNLGVLHHQRGELEEAKAMFLRALAINRYLGQNEDVADGYSRLATVFRALGDPDGAESMYLEALALDEMLGRRKEVAANTLGLGIIYQSRGEMEQARVYLEQVSVLLGELGLDSEKHVIDRSLLDMSPVDKESLEP